MTQLDYFNDSYLFQSQAQVLELIQDDAGTRLLLDRTIFYPQGGGQPSDQGLITGQNGLFIVNKVMWTPDGRVEHWGTLNGEMGTGEAVQLQIDEEKRRLHARLHSAGHILDSAIRACGLSWEPQKGYHFPDGPYVEYTGDLPENLEELLAKMQAAAQGLVDAGSVMSQESTPREGAKPFRVVTLVPGASIPCGGTHVHKSSDIGVLLIRSIKGRGGAIRVGYSVG